MQTIATTSRADAVGDLVEAMLGFHGALRRRGEEWGEVAADLSRTDVVILGLLATQGPLRPGRIADRLGCSPSVVSRRLAALDHAGHVTRDTDPLDGRAELVAVSAAGRDRLALVHRALAEQLAERLEDWAADDVVRATALVSDLTDRLVRPHA